MGLGLVQVIQDRFVQTSTAYSGRLDSGTLPSATDTAGRRNKTQPDDNKSQIVLSGVKYFGLKEFLVHVVKACDVFSTQTFQYGTCFNPRVFQVYVLKRPHVDEFLKRMGELFECVLFTASLAKVRRSSAAVTPSSVYRVVSEQKKLSLLLSCCSEHELSKIANRRQRQQ